MAAALDTRAVPVPLVCAHCGCHFLHYRAPNSRRFPKTCSNECRQKLAAVGVERRAAGVYLNKRAQGRKPKVVVPRHPVTCEHCGKTVLRKMRSARFCSAGCVQEHHKVLRRSGPTVECQCAACGKSFMPKTRGNVWCSRECRLRVWYPVKRAKRRAATAIGHVDPIAVFDRDGWRCHICGRKTPKGKRGTFEPEAPELDHIIPLSVGGAHSYENTACSCRACNMAKGASPRGQMLLFG